LVSDYILSPLKLAPTGHSVALFLRHSIRFPILNPAETWSAQLTPEGFALAEEFGVTIARNWRSGRIRTSPVTRCMDTGVSIARGAGWELPILADYRLSFPYIENAWDGLFTSGNERQKLKEGELVKNFLLEDLDTPNKLNIYITHDSNIIFLAKYLLAQVITEANWPNYLEGMAIWCENGQLQVAWRGVIYPICNGHEDEPCTAEEMDRAVF
jgi:hypothetical protein